MYSAMYISALGRKEIKIQSEQGDTYYYVRVAIKEKLIEILSRMPLIKMETNV